MRELHLLRLLPYHHEEHDAEQHPGEHQHLLVWEVAVRDEGEQRHDAAEGEPYENTVQHGSAAELEPVVLEEENDLEAFTVEGREAQQPEPQEKASPRCAGAGGALE